MGVQFFVKGLLGVGCLWSLKAVYDFCSVVRVFRVWVSGFALLG